MPAKTKKAGNAPSTSAKPPSPPNTNTTQSSVPPVPPVPPASVAGKSEDSRSAQGAASTGNIAVANSADGGTGNLASQPAVNRKKQKRREKEAARRAAEQRIESEILAHNGYGPTSRGPTRGYFREETEVFHHGYVDEAGDGDEAFFSGTEDQLHGHEHLLQNGFGQPEQAANGMTGKRKKRAKKAGEIASLSGTHAGNSYPKLRDTPPLVRPHPPPAPSLSAAGLRSAHQNFSHDQIWNTSTQAERENVKQFWLELGEEERRSLVKVEKEAVLRKMKEQQKHSCSCTVCGRKRTAIEEELEVLYDAYYEELEQFANHNNDLPHGAAIMSDPRVYKHLHNPRHPMAGQFPLERTGHDPTEDGEDPEDEDYDDDEETYSDEDIEEIPRGPPDFFTFGNSLTVKDGILTVADDLLKNDGKHFIEMMESLAEKRMQREEAIHSLSPALAHRNSHQGHNHPPVDDDEDYDDDEDDEDYDSQDEDDLEADEMDAMTEEQRMEEGRRMFQIFAARMFEQRVLTAYREKVAQERQRKLIEELEEENRRDSQREAKRAKEAARKKEKKKMQKQVREGEKAKKEAEKAEQEAAARAIEEKKAEEQRQRREEQRKKREVEKRAADEERLRKEAEKQKRAQEERERQQELERKQREAKEKEKRKREETRKKELEEKEAKEREARERKAKKEQDRKKLQEEAQKNTQAAAKAEKETRGRTRKEDQVRQSARRIPIAVPPAIHPPHPSTLQSPQLQVATPVIPAKAPMSARRRETPQQDPQSYGSSPQSQQAPTTETTLSSTPSSTSIALPNTSASTNALGKQQGQGPLLHHPQPSAPLSPLSNQTRLNQLPYGYNGMPGALINGAGTAASIGMMPGMVPPMHMHQAPPVGGLHRAYGPPNGTPFSPGMNGNRQFTQGPPSHIQSQGTTAPVAPVAQKHPAKSQSHSRQQSASYDRVADSAHQPTPISRPTPIGQSSSSTPDKKENRNVSDYEVEQLATQLGSKALLDDSDIPLTASSTDQMSAPGAPGSGRAPFSSFPDSKHDVFQPGNWGAFSPTGGLTGPPNWGAPPGGLAPKQGGGWPTHHQPGVNAFGIIGGGSGGGGGGVHATYRPHASRPVAIRLMVAEACKKLSATPGTSSDGYHPVQFLLRQLEQMKPPHEPVVSLNEMLEICDTEGNAQNGGGNFVVRGDSFQGQSVKFEPAGGIGDKRAVAGDIGSPLVATSQLATFGGMNQRH